MIIKKTKFFEDILVFALVPAFIIVLLISYNRFMIRHDYLIGYEVVCNPAINSCFVNCESGDCIYYKKIIKYAPDLYKECGNDIRNCETANLCLSSNQHCSVTYCEEGISNSICSASIAGPVTDGGNQGTSEARDILINSQGNTDI